MADKTLAEKLAKVSGGNAPQTTTVSTGSLKKDAGAGSTL